MAEPLSGQLLLNPFPGMPSGVLAPVAGAVCKGCSGVAMWPFGPVLCPVVPAEQPAPSAGARWALPAAEAAGAGRSCRVASGRAAPPSPTCRGCSGDPSLRQQQLFQ